MSKRQGLKTGMHVSALAGALFALLATAMPAAAQQTRIMTADKHNEYGLVYTLPTTALRFDVTARRTVNHAGPFFQYAKKYVGTDKVIKEDSEQWQILSVKATPFGVADNSEQYLMQLKPGALTYICVAEDGMLLAINREVEAPAMPEVTAETELTSNANVKEYLQYVNEDFLASKSSAKQAQMLSESLMEVRDSKISLTRGTAETMPTDGRQLELMLSSLAHQEEVLTAAFIGATETQTVTRSFIYTPALENEKKVLFRMSDFAGFVEPDDYSGDPVYITMEITRQGELPLDSKGNEKALPKDAVVYNIPGAAKIALTFNGKKLWADEVECAQLGVVFGLNPALFSDKKGRSYATFDATTGALRQIGELNVE